MAGGNKPTDNQINALFHMTTWVLPRDLEKAAIKYIEENATRKEVSNELVRIRSLKIARRLQLKEDVFCGKVWKNFDWRKFCRE